MKRWIGSTLLAGLMLALAGRGQAQMIIIANSSMTVESISRGEIRDIFTGTASSLSGRALVRPALLKTGPAHAELLKAYIGVPENEFRANWMKILFAGKQLLPPNLDSEADMVAYVEQHPTAIGYIQRSTPHKGVMVLVVR